MDIQSGSKKLQPFLKWPGGKRWLTNKYGKFIPGEFEHYYEPFLGGGAMFFFLAPESATLSDLNIDLINLYEVMRDNYEELADSMRVHQKYHSKEYYYTIRSKECKDPIESASRFLYLNRMCFNGMYRVNKSGHFNVPIGTKKNCIYDIELFPYYSEMLKNAELISCDFSETIKKAQKNDLVFADPPYAISSSQSGFIGYNDELFTWADQMRLLDALFVAKSKGAYIISTNVCYEPLKQLYIDKGFHVQTISRYSVISGNPDKRRVQDELLISSWPLTKG